MGGLTPLMLAAKEHNISTVEYHHTKILILVKRHMVMKIAKTINACNWQQSAINLCTVV